MRKLRRHYYSLVQYIDGKWHLQFGDYSKGTVEYEMECYRGNGIPADKLRIIKSHDDQKSIKSQCDVLNTVAKG